MNSLNILRQVPRDETISHETHFFWNNFADYIVDLEPEVLLTYTSVQTTRKCMQLFVWFQQQFKIFHESTIVFWGTCFDRNLRSKMHYSTKIYFSKLFKHSHFPNIPIFVSYFWML